MTTLSQEIFMLSVSHAHYRNRYGAHVANQALERIAKAYPESRNILVANIEKLREAYDNDNTPTKRKFRRVVDEVVDLIYEYRLPFYDETFQYIDESMIEFSEYEAKYAQENIYNKAAEETFDGLPIVLLFAGVSGASVYAATMNSELSLGDRLSGTLNNLLKGIPASERQRMKDSLRSLFNGKTASNQQIIRSIFNKKNKKAAESISRSSIDSITRTAVNSAGNQAARLTAQANEDLIRGYRNVAVFDNRISAICKSIALKYKDTVLPNYDDFPPVPRHLRCRSMIQLVMKPWGEVLGTGNIGIKQDDGKIKYFAGAKKASPAQIQDALEKEGLTNLQITQFMERLRGETSETTLAGFVAEQKRRGNREFLDSFFDSKERAQMYIDGKYTADQLFDLESRKPMALELLR